MKIDQIGYRAKGYWHKFFALLAFSILASSIAGFGEESVGAAASGHQPIKWSRELPTKTCPNSQTNNCQSSSPLLVDLNGDNLLDVVVGTNKGHVVAYNHDGALLWDTDIAPAFGMSPGSQEIHSTPAAADIDGDSQIEVAVGVGSHFTNVCTNGGVIVLDHLGGVEPGWPKMSLDGDNDGCRDTIYSSPALGDLDRDGDLEIVVGGFDKRISAWNHDGSLLPGFPVDSNLLGRFPLWGNLVGRLADTIWSSPSLADINGDGFLEIIIGTDEGNFDSRWGGDSGGWTCPFQLPAGWTPGYCGGSLYALDRFGDLVPGFPYYVLETVQSSPALIDVNGDGKSEMFFGTGSYYNKFTPDHPTYGFRLFGKDGSSADLPGWSSSGESGLALGGSTASSPAIGDIAGDDQPEVVMLANDNKLYAWHLNGAPVSGFPMTPLTQSGQSLASFSVGTAPVLANFDQDSKMEIFFNQAWVVNIVDGNGAQLTSTNYPSDPRPSYFSDGNLINTPAVGDMDGDGVLELAASNSKLSVWDLPAGSEQAAWPMFKANPARSGEFPQARLQVAPNELNIFHAKDDHSDAQVELVIQNIGSGIFNWTASYPKELSISQSSGTVSSGSPVLMTVTVQTAGIPEGEHYLGNITINATMDTGEVVNAQESINVRLIIGDNYTIFTPFVNQ